MTVNIGHAEDIDLGDGLAGVMPGSSADVHLEVDENSGAAGAAIALTRFDAVIKQHAPVAVLAMRGLPRKFFQQPKAL